MPVLALSVSLLFFDHLIQDFVKFRLIWLVDLD
jgi:hypothetical protein